MYLPPYDPSYDGKMVFRLDMAKLLPGDIILTRNRRPLQKSARKTSSVIAAAGRSNFSHAMLCVELPTVVEALGHGVSTFAIGNSFYHSREDVKVLRYPDAARARRAGAAAGLFIGKGYSVRMALNSVMPSVSGTARIPKRTFCSALVAAAFRAAGTAEFQSIDPLKTTPGDLERLAFLADVTASVSTEILAPANIEAMSALDGERTVSPMADQAKILFALHAAVSGDVSAFLARWQVKLAEPTTFFEVLRFLVQALDWATQDSDPLRQPYLRDLRSIDHKLADAFDKGELARINAAASALDNETNARLIRESFSEDPDFDVTDLQGLLVATGRQIISRSWPLEPKNRRPGLSMAWDRWCDLTEENLKDLWLRQSALEEILARIGASQVAT